MTLEEFEGKSYVEFEPYDEPPKCTDFVLDEKRTIRLKNKNTNKIEEITFRFSGAVERPDKKGYQWSWGNVESEGWPNCDLVFNYDLAGNCIKITVSLSGKSASNETYKKMTKNSSCPASFTANDVFRHPEYLKKDD